MATGAILGRRLIHQNRPAIYLSLVLVAIAARHLGVRSIKRESGFTMIEVGYPPHCVVMTDGAFRLLGCDFKLPGVNVFMAAGAGHGSIPKHGPAKARRERSGFVAQVAGHAAMPGGERKPGGRMVEFGDIQPGLEVVTTRTAGGRGTGLGREAGAKLAPVGILMAGLTG